MTAPPDVASEMSANGDSVTLSANIAPNKGIPSTNYIWVAAISGGVPMGEYSDRASGVTLYSELSNKHSQQLFSWSCIWDRRRELLDLFLLIIDKLSVCLYNPTLYVQIHTVTLHKSMTYCVWLCTRRSHYSVVNMGMQQSLGLGNNGITSTTTNHNLEQSSNKYSRVGGAALWLILYVKNWFTDENGCAVTKTSDVLCKPWASAHQKMIRKRKKLKP